MNLHLRLGLVAAFVLGWTCSVPAVTVNDGATTNNLVQFSNSDPDATVGVVDTLTVDSNGFLVAAQSGDDQKFALRTVWYASAFAPTNGVYTVSADFQPAADYFAHRGGAMGWLSLASSNGIALQVTPGDLSPASSGATTFRLSVIDFSASNGNDNDSFERLYDTNGVPATEDHLGSGLYAAGPNYSATNMATFQLAFTAPSAADLAVVTNATAHITAMVFQGTNASGPVQVGQTMELLTDLPVPDAKVHRLGYFALWGAIFDSGDVIGYLDNLKAEGGIGVAPTNVPPTVTISSPTNGATFIEPANITLTATAMDTDGTVTRVEFFAGADHLGTATNSPFSLTWSNVVAGSYALTAQAIDDSAGTSASAAVNITVTGSTVGEPTLAIQPSGSSVILSWPAAATGFRLQAKDSLSIDTWTDISATSNPYTDSVTNFPARFYRLIRP